MDKNQISTEKIKKSMVGKVTSDKMDKTIVVQVERSFVDPRLDKVMRISKKYKVHDEKNHAKEGDVVEICEGKPQSKEKYMYLVRVVKSQNQK